MTLSVAVAVPGRKSANRLRSKSKRPPFAARVTALLSTVSGAIERTGSVTRFDRMSPFGSVSATSSVPSPTAAPVTGIRKVSRRPSTRSKRRGAVSSKATIPSAPDTARLAAPVGPSTWVTSMAIRERSPGARKRGWLTAITTGSRTIIAALASPTPVFDQASAISFSVPLKSGMSSGTAAVPSAPTVTTPENSATSASIGGGLS